MCGLMLLPNVFSLNTMADVIATIVVDVITTLFILYCIWLVVCHICVANVIATVADVIAYHICISWLMVLPEYWQVL